MANGDLSIATKCYAAAAVLNPKNVDICIERAGIYYKQRFTGKCIAQCQLAIKMALEQADAASEVADRVKHQVSVVKAREYLAMVYLLDGDEKAAEVQWEAIGELGVDPKKSKARAMVVKAARDNGFDPQSPVHGSTQADNLNKDNTSKVPDLISDAVIRRARESGGGGGGGGGGGKSKKKKSKANAKAAAAAAAATKEAADASAAAAAAASAAAAATAKKADKGVKKGRPLPSFLRDMGGTTDAPKEATPLIASVGKDASVKDDDTASHSSQAEQDSPPPMTPTSRTDVAAAAKHRASEAEAASLLGGFGKTFAAASSDASTSSASSSPPPPPCKAKTKASVPGFSKVQCSFQETTNLAKAAKAALTAAGGKLKKRARAVPQLDVPPPPPLVVEARQMLTNHLGRIENALERADLVVTAIAQGHSEPSKLLRTDNPDDFPKGMFCLKKTLLRLQGLSNADYNGALCMPLEYNWKNGK